MRFHKRIQIFIIGLAFFIFSFAATQKVFTQLAKAATTGPQLSLFSNTNTSIPNQTFDVNIGMTNLVNAITAVDAVAVFDSNILEVTGVTLGNTYLKTIAPQDANGTFDITKAVFIDPDPTKSRVEIGLISFDPNTQQPTTPIIQDYDPQTNPIAIIHFKTKAIGATTIGLKFDGIGVTTDSNLVTNDLGDPQDVLASVSNDLNFTVAYLPSPTPTPSISPSPTPTPSPSATPIPTPTPSPSATPLPSPIACSQIDYNASGAIDVQDIMQASSRWNTKTGDLNYNAIYDLNNDGQINIIDVQTIAGRWLENCVPIIGTGNR